MTKTTHRWLVASSALRSAWLVVALSACSGCVRVPAYARGRLAHPSMQGGPRANAGQAHLYSIREGASGGRLGAGSGCGCN